MAEDFQADLKTAIDFEQAWLADELGKAIANLGYPVGMGVAPNPATMETAAKTICDRFLFITNAMLAERSKVQS